MNATRCTTEPRPRRQPRSAADPDAALMQRVGQGDAEAFDRLLSRYRPRVFGRLYRELGSREEAEDFTQEVFLRLYRYRGRYQPRAKFATWLFHITTNVARNALRSRRRRPCLPLAAVAGADEAPPLEGMLPDRGEAPERPLEREELARRVRSAISGLGDRQRAAVELFQFEDRSYTEVAARMDVTPKAAKSLLYRARNQLRDLLLASAPAEGWD